MSGVEWMADQGVLHVSLEPYGVAWLEPFRKPGGTVQVDTREPVD